MKWLYTAPNDEDGFDLMVRLDWADVKRIDAARRPGEKRSDVMARMTLTEVAP